MRLITWLTVFISCTLFHATWMLGLVYSLNRSLFTPTSWVTRLYSQTINGQEVTPVIVVIGLAVFFFTLPSRFDPAIQLKEFNERCRKRSEGQ